MNFKDLQQNWDKLGRIDPFWAILTDPSKKNNGWNGEEFFKTGEEEIEWLMDYIASLPVAIARGWALDFGCGVGRLTQPLSKYFQHCVGVDIAASMIHLARKYNQYGGRCQYRLNEFEDLRLFENDQFDLIYSNIVLQHMEARYSKRYLEEFIRTLRVGGLAIFQIPSELTSARTSLLPGDAIFEARIDVSSPRLAADPGAKMSVVVTVTNVSSQVWPAEKRNKYPVRLGNHWLSPNGEMLRLDDARAILSSELKPSESAELSLNVTAPAEEGEYLLELDMVQEGIAWFKNRGSSTARLPVRVGRSAVGADERAVSPKTSQGDCSIDEPSMEMHCVLLDVVVETVTSSGGRVVDIQEYGSAGPDYVSYRYCVTK